MDIVVDNRKEQSKTQGRGGWGGYCSGQEREKQSKTQGREGGVDIKVDKRGEGVDIVMDEWMREREGERWWTL